MQRGMQFIARFAAYGLCLYLMNRIRESRWK